MKDNKYKRLKLIIYQTAFESQKEKFFFCVSYVKIIISI